jgi:hypothetical protein
MVLAAAAAAAAGTGAASSEILTTISAKDADRETVRQLEMLADILGVVQRYVDDEIASDAAMEKIVKILEPGDQGEGKT